MCNLLGITCSAFYEWKHRVVPAEEQYNRRAKQKGQKSCLTPKLKKEIENG